MRADFAFYDLMKELLAKTKLKPIHWKVWFLSAMGIFLDGYDLFIISCALPLITTEFHPTPILQGLIASSAILGMILGALLGGRLTDTFGRKKNLSY